MIQTTNCLVDFDSIKQMITVSFVVIFQKLIMKCTSAIANTSVHF